MNRVLIFLNDNIACLNSILPVTRLLSLFQTITKDGKIASADPLSVTVVKVINLDAERCSTVIKASNVEATLNNDPALSAMRAYAEIQGYFTVKIFGLISTTGDRTGEELNLVAKSQRFDVVILPLNMDEHFAKFPKAYCRLADEAAKNPAQVVAVFANRSDFLSTKNSPKNILALTSDVCDNKVRKMLSIISTTNVVNNFNEIDNRNFEFSTTTDTIELVVKICNEEAYDLVILSTDWYKDHNICKKTDQNRTKRVFSRIRQRIQKILNCKLCCLCLTDDEDLNDGGYLVEKKGRSNFKQKDVDEILSNFLPKLSTKTSALILL